MVGTPLPGLKQSNLGGVITKLTQFVERAIALYRLYGFNASGYATCGTIEYYANLSAQSEKPDFWIDCVKYSISCCFSYLQGLETPPNDNNLQGFKVGRLLLGRAHRFLISLRRKDPDRFISLLTSISIGLKGSLPRPGPRRMFLSELTTIKKLFLEIPTRPHVIHQPLEIISNLMTSIPQPGASFDANSRSRVMPRILRSRGIGVSALKNAVSKTVREVFAGESFGIKDLRNFTFPSTSANYMNSRMGGGSVPIVKEEYDLWKKGGGDLDIDGDLPADFHKEFNDFSISQEKIRVWKEWSKDKLRSYTLNGEIREYYCSGEWVERTRLRIHDPSYLEQENLEFYHFLVRRCVKEEPSVVPQALAEALKVRVITKCPPLLMYVVKPIQKWMAGVLKKFNVFRLTGETISAKVINETFGTLRDGRHYLSGDYSDATNNLMKEYSEIVAEEVSNYINVEYFDVQSNDTLRTLLKRSLVGFSINYADIFERLAAYKKQNSGESFEDLFEKVMGTIPRDGIARQVDGQLMGSVTSFCVLCLINAAICRYCLEWDEGKQLTLRECRLLINGDDCVFEIGPFGHELWKVVCPMVGLKPSVGKYYYTSTFIQMNSRTFVPVDVFTDETGEKSTWKCIPFVLYGLVNGNGRTSGSTPFDFGSQYNTFMETAPHYLRGELHRKSIGLWKRRLAQTKCDRVLQNIPWYLPTCYGGLGLDPRLAGIDLSDKDKRMVSYMKESNVCPPPTNEAEWLIYKNVMSLYPDRCLTWQDESDVTSRVFNNYLMQQMFHKSSYLDCSTSQFCLLNSGSVAGGAAIVRPGMFMHLRDWWRRNLKSKNLRFEPCADPYEKRERLLPLVDVGYFNGHFNDFSCVWDRASWL